MLPRPSVRIGQPSGSTSPASSSAKLKFIRLKCLTLGSRASEEKLWVRTITVGIHRVEVSEAREADLTRDSSTAPLLAPFARGLQVHRNELEQLDEAIRVTLTSLAERLGSLTCGRTAPDRRGDGYAPKDRGGPTDIWGHTLRGTEFSPGLVIRERARRTWTEWRVPIGGLPYAVGLTGPSPSGSSRSLRAGATTPRRRSS